jgi:tetratricopeptide (TPR) repeat protein/transcriptional regulator with XRE-family HTH domain
VPLATVHLPAALPLGGRNVAVVTEQRALSFAELLRRLRTDAGLTQEELAEAASVSHRSISDLERGIHQTARKDTARLLADALNLAGAARPAFEAAALGRRPSDAEGVPGSPGALTRSVAATTPTLPHDIRSFTGRQPELAQLMRAVRGDSGVVGIYAIDGMAGVGKSAFAVHAAHLIEHRFPDGQIFLPLHAHTAGQRPVDPADALASLLLTTGVAADRIPPGLSERIGLWRSHLAGKRALLLLDDAAGHEQVRPLLPAAPGCLVLVTSRRHLSALDDATSICLETLPSDEAAALLIRLADRPDVDPEDRAVGEVNRLCGYLPLAIGMLARQLHHHPSWTVAGLAEDLAAARDRLELMHAENLSVAAAFDMSYQDLHADQQRLFRRLGLYPGTDIDVYAATALDGTSVTATRRRLNELFDQHLVTEPVSGRYSMHDLIREHARALAATDDPEDRDSAIGKLIEYYVNAATAVGPHFNRGAAAVGDSSAALPQPTSLEEAAKWMEAERANMHAVVDYAALRKWPRPGIAIAAAMSGFLRLHGHWTQLRVLHVTALDTAHQAGYHDGEIGALTSLGIVQRLTGDYEAASATLTRAIELCIGLANRGEQANALVALGAVQRLTVDFRTASATLSKALELHRSSGDQLGQADALNELGWVQQLTGDYPAATASHKLALELYQGLGDQLGQADSLRYLGRVYQETGDYEAVISSYATALELYRSLNDRLGQAHTLRDLGIAQHVSDDYLLAGDTMTKALELYRGLGHHLGQAETLNNLGDLHSLSDPIRARDYHEQALSIARDITALLEEARALEGIGNSDIQDKKPERGGIFLRQALEIYVRIGSPHAGRVEGTLTFHVL